MRTDGSASTSPERDREVHRYTVLCGPVLSCVTTVSRVALYIRNGMETADAAQEGPTSMQIIALRLALDFPVVPGSLTEVNTPTPHTYKHPHTHQGPVMASGAAVGENVLWVSPLSSLPILLMSCDKIICASDCQCVLQPDRVPQ